MQPVFGGSEIRTFTGNIHYDLLIFVAIWILSICGLIWALKRDGDCTVDTYSDNFENLIVGPIVILFFCMPMLIGMTLGGGFIWVGLFFLGLLVIGMAWGFMSAFG